MASTGVFLACFMFWQLGAAHIIEILTTTRPDGKIPEFDCNKPMDIVFVLDGSKKMGLKDFSQQLVFVRRFMKDVDVSESTVRIGVATISAEIRHDFSLNSYKTKAEIKKALSSITDSIENDRHGKPHAWLALEYLRTKAFSAENGGRIGVPKVAIILTDSWSGDKEKTLAEAKLLHNEPIRVYTIGVEHFSLEELEAIASKPDYIYVASEFGAIKDIEDPIRENVCRIVCGPAPLDVIFMVDESNSVADEDIDKQNEFVDRFIRDSLIGPKFTQVGVVSFSTNVDNHFFLNQHQNSGDLLSAVNALKRSSGDTYANKAIRFIKDQGFTHEHGGRQGVPHVVIVITDGQSTLPAETKKAAAELRRSGVVVFAIGVGGSVDFDEINAIAGDPARVYQVRSYQALKKIETSLFARVCTVQSANAVQ